MPKSIEQMLNLERQHIDRFGSAADLARKSGNVDLYITNIAEVFRGHLMAGLILWRHQLSGLALMLRGGLTCLKEAFDELQCTNELGSTSFDKLPIEKANFLASLLGEPFLVARVRPEAPDRLLDASITHVFQSREFDRSWETNISLLKQITGAALTTETYSVYKELIESRTAQHSAELVRRAIALFERRKRDAFYRGGDQTDGGGECNAITVDYRLAAIIKFLNLRSDSVHDWIDR